ncbi:MAG: hypothetical protein IJP96_06975 [Synergistaceae bacterium]|nr:hypothetical protein [Synergistaceae bacterium]
MADKKEKLKELRDVFAKKRLTFDKDGFPRDTEGIYSTLYKGLEKAKVLDSEYLKNFGKIVDKLGERLSGTDYMNELSFNECCTLMTFFLRGERMSPGHFFSRVKDGTILKLLDRAVETA